MTRLARLPLLALLPALMPALLLSCSHGAPAPATPGAPPAQAFVSHLDGLQRAVEARIAQESGTHGVAIIDIETGRTLGVNDRLVFHAASTMKVPILLELYRRAAAGEIDVDADTEVMNVFRSIADGSAYSLSADGDSDASLYERIGTRVPLRELARLMIVRSSNLAANTLIDVLDAARVRETTDRVGGTGVNVLRGVEDGPAYSAGMNNTTTARGLANVLASIARCDVLPGPACSEVRETLAGQEFSDMIPAGLPAGTRVANKTGWLTDVQHDGAIVLPEQSPPFVIVVLTEGAADRAVAKQVGADVARLAWDALGPGGTLRPEWPARTRDLLALHNQFRVHAFPAATLRHSEVWSVLSPIAAAAPHIEMEQVGRSAHGRAINLIRAGDGPVRVLFWSQMHGDETTATRALVDLFNYIAHADDARVRNWRERLTILAVPMLNPDGAEPHQRRNMLGIDVNRDARYLSTPEGRTLKRVQERWQPQFGFNLHDQNPRSRVGNTSRLAAMSLLAPRPDEDGTPTPGYIRARHLTAHLAGVLGPLAGAHLTQYDDSYNARAFGDGMQTWGVSTVLIESGGWRGDESKHYLRSVNFVALVSALDAIAGETYRSADVAWYTDLPRNGRSVNDLLVHGGSIVLPGLEPYRGDIAINAPAVGGPADFEIADIGDLTGVEARDTIDATGLFIHPMVEPGTPTSIGPGRAVDLDIRASADAGSAMHAEVRGTTVRFFTVPVLRP
ncbi:hypothetical protein BH23GEM10_BH23GEM10_10890 [soil metagenome]